MVAPSPALIALGRRVPELLFHEVKRKWLFSDEERTRLFDAAREYERAVSFIEGRRKRFPEREGAARAQKNAALDAALDVLSKADAGGDVLLGVAAKVRLALVGLQRSSAGLSAMSQRIGRPAGDLGSMFRSDLDQYSRIRLARMLTVKVEELESVEAEFRRLMRTKRDAVAVLGKHHESIAALLDEVTAERKRQRAKARSTRSVRGKPHPEQTLVLDAAEPRREPKAPRSLAQVRPRLALGRPAVVDVAEEYSAGTVELGAHGEALCFRTVVWPAWAALLTSNRVAAVALIQRIVERHWTAGPELLARIASLEVANHEESRSLIEGVLWPATTKYGDVIGFDMFQPTPAGSDWVCVEVKTTAGPPTAPFVMTRNEWATAQREGARYSVYRLGWALDPEPALRVITGLALQVEQGAVSLTPSQYAVAF